MKKNWILLLLGSVIVLCAFLFNLFYQEAKREAIHNIDVQQSLHARQAAQGIEHFFIHWMGILTVLSESSHIIDLDQAGKKNIDNFYEANRKQIRGITRVDARGRIVYTIPYDRKLIGRDISYQKHVQEVMRTRKPVISDVFTAVQGYQTVALHVPVFGNGIYRGTIAITLDFQALASQYLEVIKIGKTGYAWVISRDGTELYCPVPGHTGKSVYTNCAAFPSILAMAGEMQKGHQGTTTYTFNQIGEQAVKTVKKHAVYMPITIGNTFWSIVVASTEGEVLASLAAFRIRLILIIALFLAGALLFSYYGLKARFIIKEEEKRLTAEKELKESEERFRTLSDKTPLGMSLIDSDGRYEYVNPAFVKTFGYDLSDIPTGKEWFSTAFPDPEYRREVMAGWKDDLIAHAQLEIRPRIYNVRCKGGASKTILFRPVTLSDGKQLIIYEDITERKQAESQMEAALEAMWKSEKTAKRLADESEVVAEIGRIISSTLDIEQVYERFADKVKELIPFDRIAINTINVKDYSRTIRYVQGDAFAGNRIGEVVSLAGTGVEEIIRTKSSMLVNNKSTEDMKGKLLFAFKFGAQSTMLIPLILKDEVIGSLAIHSARADAYSENDLRLAERMASQIAGSIANAQLFRERTQAEEKLQHTLDSLRRAVSTTIQVMVSAVEARDPYTAGHQIRSADLARAIATEIGLPQDKIEGLRMAGSIHDIGKISIPAEILSKPTKLSEIEFSLIKAHAQRGFEMLKDVESPWPLAEIVYQHHERMDGSGYPRNLKGDEIMIEARILSIADVVEAMASHRPYRPGLGIDAALNEIEKNKGIFYDNTVADACLRLFREKDFRLEGTY